MRPKISIIVPVYNKEDYLAECLDSITGQSLREIEILVIDDGSTDSSRCIVEQYVSDDPRVHLVAQENKGVSFARNRGIEEAKGEYLAFCDPDDYLSSPDALEKLYRGAVDNRVSACGGGLCEVDEESGEVRTLFDEIHSSQAFTEPKLMSYEEYQFDYGFYRFIYSRRLINEKGIRFPGYVRFQDPPFMVEALIAAGSFYAIPDCVYSYRVGHNAVEWTEAKARDLIRGISDVIRISGENSLRKLHSLAVRRLEAEYEYVFDLHEESMPIMAELVRCNSLVIPDMLDSDQREKGLVSPDLYLLAPLRRRLQSIEALKAETASLQIAVEEANMACARRVDEVVAASEDALRCIEASVSFRVGRAVTALPRKIRDAVRS